jgi:hypothetical protein
MVDRADALARAVNDAMRWDEGESDLSHPLRPEAAQRALDALEKDGYQLVYAAPGTVHVIAEGMTCTVWQAVGDRETNAIVHVGAVLDDLDDETAAARVALYLAARYAPEDS